MPKDHYTVLCACGSSIATSTLMASRLVDLFKQNNMDVSIKKTSYADLDKDIKLHKPDLIVSSTNFKRDLGVTTLLGLPYITGMGKAQLDKQILEILQSLS